MHVARVFWFWSIGLGSGISLALSCGDNLGVEVTADAAIDAAIDAARAPDAFPTCDCPVVEPPLPGRIIMITGTRVFPANDVSVDSVVCPVGSRPIFGSCTTDQFNPTLNIALRQFGIFAKSPQEWWCIYRNLENVPVTIRTTAICLKPAS
jgi:hypothetical protein